MNGWPGLPIPPDTANVGPLAHPSWPGAYTPYTGPANITTSNGVYNFMDFEGCTVSAPGNIFTGCRFRSNWTDGWNVKVNDTSNGVTQFKYCEISPLVVADPPDPVGPSWPSSGAKQNVYGNPTPGWMITRSQSYQYGILQTAGRMLVQDCDIWGFANAIVLFGTGQKTIRRCWIHDAAHEGPPPESHQDGIGHLDNSGCSNVLIEDCTVASLGNTNAIAWQGGNYASIIVRRNFLSGFGYCVNYSMLGTSTGIVFEDNLLATDIGWFFGPLYADFSGLFNQSGCSWSGNKLRVAPGTVPRTGTWPYTSADHMKFIHPDGALSATDW